MAEYIPYDLETDPDQVAADGFDYLRSKVEGWEPSPGHLETWLIEAIARMATELAGTASLIPTTIFRYFGANLVGIPPVDASPASAGTIWVMRDTLGHTIPAGTLVSKLDASGEAVLFETFEEIVIPPGDPDENDALIIAVEPGVGANGLTGAMTLVDSLDAVLSVTINGISSGGIDAEDDITYLDRLATQLRLLAPRPILPADFAAMALNIPGVERAVAIDGYDPSTDTFENERMVAVVAVDAIGNPVGSQIKTQVQEYLESNREVNFVVNVIDATYSTIDVTYTVTKYDGYDAADVQLRVDDALRNYLDPNNWGIPPSGDQRTWYNQPVMRYLELAALINSVEGVNYVNDLSFGETGTPLEATDLVLNGRAPLPRPGIMTGTVV